jgi:hypothetical protein
MPPTPTPAVYICRHATSGTTAHGYDPLIHLLLARAGFQPEEFFGQRYYRLPYDLGTERENAMATDAARMIRAAHYEVDLAPDLDQDATTDQRTAAPGPCPMHP